MTYSADLDKLTGCWFTELPKAYEKSVVLGGGKVLFPLENPEEIATILEEYILSVARRAHKAGMRAAKGEIRKAIFD